MASTVTVWLLDALLVFTLVLLAWRALASTDLFSAIIIFIGFGLVMSLVWIRLRAPDVALAEAAIGAGISGALLLNAYAKQHSTPSKTLPTASLQSSARLLTINLSFLILGLVLLLPLAWAILSLPPESAGLRNSVDQHIALSGVTNPVTAVLLNFRGYDTLLEIAVLLLAMLAVWVINGCKPHSTISPQLNNSALQGLSATVSPLLILTAGYVLWIGSSRPGGAFQAGALLSGAAVMMILANYSVGKVKQLWIRLVSSLALIVFIVIGTALITNGKFLQYPAAWAGTLILIIETAATVSIGVILTALFLGYEPYNVPTPQADKHLPSDKDIS